MRKRTTTDFINEAKLIHGERYDYRLVEYITNKTPVKIICQNHGVFEQRPEKHLNGQNCPKCGGKNKTTDQFITEARSIHGDLYDYSLVRYTSATSKVKIICNHHGVFEQTPNNHLSGQNCPQCVGGIRSNTEKFIEKAKTVHGNRYDYSHVEYINNHTNVKIVCHEHGFFNQMPANHLKGNGCPLCAQTKPTYYRPIY